MIREEDMYIRNLSGTIMYKDTPVFDFSIVNGELVKYRQYREDSVNLPPEISLWGYSYDNINCFFRRRVVKDGAMWITEYLHAMGMEKYDFESIVRFHHGKNYLDNYWIKDMI